VRDGYSSREKRLTLKPGKEESEEFSLSRSRGWYDLVITIEGDQDFESHYAGHVENGEDSITDPLMGGLV
jgi:phospholipase C